MQNEKRKALLEHESAKLRECDEGLQREMKDWKSLLMPRKQVKTRLNRQWVKTFHKHVKNEGVW